ncbi:MAG: outer membrane protein assembly factor BamA, partial [Bacteroidia bacterium]|nr:outer membrane protein assembly factor BamA [Bacteroidia bacterium]
MLQLIAQPESNEKKYILSGISVEGAQYSDKNSIILLSGLTIGKSISVPGEEIADAIQKLWKQNIFSDIAIEPENIVGDKVFLVIKVTERPRISRYSFTGISKGNADDLRDKINFVRGTIFT